MAVELASAYISLSANTKSIPGDVKKALGQAEGAAVSSGSSIGSKLSSGLKKTLKAGMVTAAATGAAAFGATLTKGFQRLDAIEQAQVKFEALGYTAKQQASLMDDVTNSVRGTAFATSEAADAAAMALAGGIEPGKELTGVLKTIGDSASFANKNFAEVAPIYTKAINQGKVMGDTLQQLSDNGLPAAAALAESMGKTSEEIYEMASKGEISFNDLQKAMDGAIGGQALKAGETFQGSLANVGAAAARLGEELLSSAFSSAPKVFGNISEQIDKLTEKVGPLAEVWSKKLSGSVSDFARKAAPHANDILGMLGDGLKQVGKFAQSAVGPLKSIGNVMGDIPFSVYTAGIANVIGQQTGLIGKLNESSGGLKDFIENVNGTKNDLRSHGINIGFVGAAMANLGDQYPWVERATQAFNDASLPLRNAGAAARDAGWEVGGMGNIVKQAEGTVKTFGGVAAGAARGGLSLLASGATGLMNALGGPWGLAITGAGWLIGQLAKKHKEAAEEERKHKEMQQQLRDTLDETSGSVTRQTRALQLKSLEESGAMDSARNLGLSQDVVADAANGNADAMNRVNRAVEGAHTKAVESSDFWKEWGSQLESVGFSARDMSAHLAGSEEATDKLREAKDRLRDQMDPSIYNFEGWQSGLRDLRGSTEGAAGEFGNLQSEVGSASEALQEAQLAAATDEINALKDGAKGASDTFKVLGDEMVRMGEEPGTVSVEMDAEKAFEVQKRLKDIGVDADYLDEERQLVINMNNGNAIIGMLDTIEGKVKYLPDGSIDIKNNTDYVNDQLVQMGILKDQDGELVMADNVGDTLRRLYEYGAFKKDRNGNLVIADNIDDVLRRVENELDGKQTSGTHTISINEIIGKTYTSSARATARAGGGLIPALAGGGFLGGYRLPTSGPGTNTTDGILGIGPGGVPLSWLDGGEWVINAKSSKKYHDLLRAINSDDDAAIGQITGHASGGSLGGGVGSFNMSGFSEFGNVATSIQSNVTGVIGSAMASAANMFTSFGSVVTDTATSVVTPQFDGMATNIQSQANSVINPAMGGVRNALTQTGAWFQNRVGTVVNPVWNAMGANIQRVRQSVTDPAMAGIRNALTATGSHFANSVNSTINPVWNSMGQNVQRVWTGVVNPAFNAIAGGLRNTVTAFSNGATGIANQWNRVRKATADPVNFAIGSVFNQGIVGMWNSASELLGTKRMAPYNYRARYAEGGFVRGPGTETSDSIPALLSKNEYVIKASAVRAFGKHNLDAINSGKVNAVNNIANDRTFRKVAVKRASGGPVKGTRAWSQLKRGYDWAKSRNGRPYVWGGSAHGASGTDCSGYMSGIADRILGGNGSRQWATGNYFASQQGAWRKGLASGFSVGITNDPGGPGGGHTAGTIGGVEGMPAVNVEAGGVNSRVKFGTSDAAGANSGFRGVYHMIVGGGGSFKQGIGSLGGGGSVVAMADIIGDDIKPFQDKMKRAVGPWNSKAGLVNKVPGAIADELGGATEKKIMKLADELDAVSGAGAGVDISGIRGDVQNQVREVFKRRGWTGKKWQDASWIIGKESSWNPTAVNPSSGAFGLFQFNPSSGTLQQYLPDRSPNPAKQARAGVRYIEDRYQANPSVARAFWERNGWYDNGGYLQPGVTRVQNDSGKPEPVFSHDQWQILKGNIFSAAQAGDLKKLTRNLGVLANGVQQAIAKMDWQKVAGEFNKAFKEGFMDGQASDIRSVFGLPDPDNIPAVKALAEFRENEKKFKEDNAKAAEDAREAATRADSAADKIEGASAPVPAKRESQSVTVGSRVARTGALASAALANPNPVSVGAAAKSGGDTIQFIVRNEQAAWSEYRKFQAKNSRGRVGAR